MRRFSALFMLFASAAAFAQSEVQTGPYVGVGLSNLDYKAEMFSVLTFDDSSVAPRIYGGIRFNEHFAFEGAHASHDDMSWSETGSANLIGNYTANIKADHEITEVRVLAYLGRVMFSLGYFDTSFKARLNGVSGTFGPIDGTRNESDNGLSYGFGGEWPINNWGIRGEVEYIDAEGAVDAWLFGVGAHYKFR